jgi:hypothetical protein
MAGVILAAGKDARSGVSVFILAGLAHGRAGGRLLLLSSSELNPRFETGTTPQKKNVHRS